MGPAGPWGIMGSKGTVAASHHPSVLGVPCGCGRLSGAVHKGGHACMHAMEMVRAVDHRATRLTCCLRRF